jgi:hypothetical protein
MYRFDRTFFEAEKKEVTVKNIVVKTGGLVEKQDALNCANYNKRRENHDKKAEEINGGLKSADKKSIFKKSKNNDENVFAPEKISSIDFREGAVPVKFQINNTKSNYSYFHQPNNIERTALTDKTNLKSLSRYF